MERIPDQRSVKSAQNLGHVYFFLSQTANTTSTNAFTDGNDVTPVTPLDTTHRHSHSGSRDSSPGSIGSGSSATVTGSASTTSSTLNPEATSFSPGSYSPQDARSSPPSPAKQPFEIRQIEGKGLGLVATELIPRGTRIISEQPLLKIDDNKLHLAWYSYNKLKQWQKETFDKLHVHAPDVGALVNTSRMYLMNPRDFSKRTEEQGKVIANHVRVMSIFGVNNFNLGHEGLAVYATASRINHSCAPNTFHGFNPNIYRFTVHAIRDIAPGEEITVNYMGGPSNYMVRSQRIEHLRTEFGFTCGCDSCSDITDESDNRRVLMNNICWGLGQYDEGAAPEWPFTPDGPANAFKLAVNAVNFLCMERLESVELTKALHAASKYALALGDWHAAVQYALREQDVQFTTLGKEVQDMVKSGAAAFCWIKEVKSVIGEAIGKKQARKLFGKFEGDVVQPSAQRLKPVENGDTAKKVKQFRRGGKNGRVMSCHGHQEHSKAMKNPAAEEHPEVGDKGSNGIGKKTETTLWAKIAAGTKEKENAKPRDG